MNKGTPATQEFADFVIAACRLFRVDELISHKVVVVCLEGLARDEAWPKREERRDD